MCTAQVYQREYLLNMLLHYSTIIAIIIQITKISWFSFMETIGLEGYWVIGITMRHIILKNIKNLRMTVCLRLSKYT
jgi:hypothetical protein